MCPSLTKAEDVMDIQRLSQSEKFQTIHVQARRKGLSAVQAMKKADLVTGQQAAEKPSWGMN